MKNNRLSIGQMAKLNHTTLATLRLYDRMGLLSPAYVNPETGYRFYDVRQCATFQLIQNNKNLHMSLKDIKSILDKSDVHYMLDLYDGKLAELEKEKRALEIKVNTLKKIMEWTDFYQHRPPVDTYSLAYLPKRYIYTKPADRDYFRENFGSFVYGISYLEAHLCQENFPQICLYTSFVSMEKENFLQKNYQASEIGVQVGEEEQHHAGVQVEASGTFACAYFDDFSRVHEYLDHLYKYCKENTYKVIGDVQCQLIGATDAHDFRKTAEFMCLQVPVKTQNGIQ